MLKKPIYNKKQIEEFRLSPLVAVDTNVTNKPSWQQKSPKQLDFDVPSEAIQQGNEAVSAEILDETDFCFGRSKKKDSEAEKEFEEERRETAGNNKDSKEVEEEVVPPRPKRETLRRSTASTPHHHQVRDDSSLSHYIPVPSYAYVTASSSPSSERSLDNRRGSGEQAATDHSKRGQSPVLYPLKVIKGKKCAQSAPEISVTAISEELIEEEPWERPHRPDRPLFHLPETDELKPEIPPKGRKPSPLPSRKVPTPEEPEDEDDETATTKAADGDGGILRRAGVGTLDDMSVSSADKVNWAVKKARSKLHNEVSKSASTISSSATSSSSSSSGNKAGSSSPHSQSRTIRDSRERYVNVRCVWCVYFLLFSLPAA